MSIRRGGFQPRPVLFKMRIAERDMSRLKMILPKAQTLTDAEISGMVHELR